MLKSEIANWKLEIAWALCYPPPNMKYTNPTIPGLYPAPSVCRANGLKEQAEFYEKCRLKVEASR